MLLPAEVELCETVGITEDEYWYFVELTQAYNGKRPKEYDELPYIVNFQALGLIFSSLFSIVLTHGTLSNKMIFTSRSQL